MVLTMGIIGFGKSALRYHLPFLNIRDNFRVKMVFSHSFEENLAKVYKSRGVNFTTDVSELLGDPEIKLVSVCTPPATHYSLAKQVLTAGKSVIVEKPFCDTLENARELLNLAKEKGQLAIPYQNRRFDGDFLAVKQVVEQGFLGKILEVESHIDYFRPHSITHVGAKYDGSFYGLGVHLIDRMLALFGRPQKVVYDIRNNEMFGSVDNYFEVDLHYNQQLKVKLKASYIVAQNYPRFIVHGTDGSFIKYGEDQQENDLKAGIMPGTPHFGEDSPMDYGLLKYRNANGDWIQKQVPTPVGDYGLFYDSVYATLEHGQEKKVTDEEVLTSMEILEAGFFKKKPMVYELDPF